MEHFEERRIIEALRSGIPSRAVGRVFTEARAAIQQKIADALLETAEGRSQGMVISGKYGEGKTHLLQTVFNMAMEQNMVVSLISLGKETPMDKLSLVYQRVMANTYLPGRQQPGISSLYNALTQGSPAFSDLQLFTLKELESDKLYFLIRSLVGLMAAEEAESRFLLEADLEGDYVSNAELKRIYKRLYNQTAKYEHPFSKTKHAQDYFALMSELFLQMGYSGWVILFDEAELIGRLGKKTRQNAYRQIARFLYPEENFRSVFSLFAVSASFEEDVIEGKHDYENAELIFPEEIAPGVCQTIRAVLKDIEGAYQLQPLTKAEMAEVLLKVKSYHELAYGWKASISDEALIRASEAGGYLLRTRLRSAIETLDQLYQYGSEASLRIGALTQEDLSEEDIPSLEGLMEGEDS